MRAVVCLKQVVDPLTPATDLALDRQARKMKPAVAGPPVINGYDEQALEAALRLRESLGKLELNISPPNIVEALFLRMREIRGAEDALPTESAARAGDAP